MARCRYQLAVAGTFQILGTVSLSESQLTFKASSLFWEIAGSENHTSHLPTAMKLCMRA